MTSAIKSMNWVLLQTAAWKYSAYFLCYSVLPECWLHTQVRLHQLLIFAVCFPGTWLVGGVHLGRLCRFLEFSNLICFSGMEDTGSGFSIFPHFSSLFFFYRSHHFFSFFAFTLCGGLSTPSCSVSSGLTVASCFWQRDKLLAWSFDVNSPLWYHQCGCLCITHVGQRHYTAAMQNEVCRSAGRNSPSHPKSKPRLCSVNKTRGEILMTAQRS